jgi:hypothetical protein
MISFSEPIYDPTTMAPFPDGAPDSYVVAPFWDDVDLRLAGNIYYEVHSRSANNPGSNQLLDEVSGFVEDSIAQSFQGSWMLIAEWKEVHPWPHGDPEISWLHAELVSLVSGACTSNSIILYTSFEYPACIHCNIAYDIIYCPLLAVIDNCVIQVNTYQGLVITDGTNSYTVFLYRCGDISWYSAPTIGFNAAGSSFANNTNDFNQIGCLNLPHSQWCNLVYLISLPNASLPSPPAVEPRM